MFEEVTSSGHKWWDANSCDKINCVICKRRIEYELNILQSLQLDDIIIFEDNHQVICGKILKIDSIENNTRRVELFYKTWINSTEICNKEKSFIITGNVEIITSIMHINHAFKDI